MSPSLITLLELATTVGAVFACAFQCYAFAFTSDDPALAALDAPPQIAWPVASAVR